MPMLCSTTAGALLPLLVIVAALVKLMVAADWSPAEAPALPRLTAPLAWLLKPPPPPMLCSSTTGLLLPELSNA